MASIRIKVKHLLLLVGGLATVLAVMVWFQGGIAYMMGKWCELGGSDERAGVYYDRAVENSPSSSIAIRAAQSKLEQLFEKTDFGYFRKFKLSGRMSMFDGSYIGADSLDRINSQYGSIARYAKKDDAFAQYTLYVAMANYFAGYGENAINLIESIEPVQDTDLKKVIVLNFAAMQMGMGNIEKGYETLKDSLEENDRYSAIQQKLCDYYRLMKGEPDVFEDDEQSREWMQALNLMDGNVLVKPFIYMDNAIAGYSDILGKTKELQQNGNVISGTVTIDGKPAAYVLVYLKNTTYRNYEASNMYSIYGTPCAAVTDSSGFFKIENVPDGIYGIGVHMDWQRIRGMALSMDRSFLLRFDGDTVMEEDINFFDTSDMVTVEDAGDGKFRFRVNMPQEVEYYTIGMDEVIEVDGNRISSNSRFYSERLYEPEYILDTGKERYRGMSTGASYGNDGIDPYNLLEPFYHTGDYAYFITFYDVRGELLYDSNGIQPGGIKGTVYIEGSPWSEADTLLLDKKYEEAIKLYEKAIYDGENGLHALKVLAELFYNGWEYDEKTGTLIHRDARKAIGYFEQLADRIGDNEQIHSALAGLYIKEGRYEEGLELLQKNKSPFSFCEIARTYGYMGKFSKAEEYYKRYQIATGHGADRLLILYILQNRRELLPETAESYTDSGSFYAEYTEGIEAYLQLDTSEYSGFFELVGKGRIDEAAQRIEGRGDDLAQFYKGLLLLQRRITDYREREAQYKDLYDRVKEPALKQLLRNFGKAFIQSGFGDP